MELNEKSAILPSVSGPGPSSARSKLTAVWGYAKVAFLTIALVSFFVRILDLLETRTPARVKAHHEILQNACPQSPAVTPSNTTLLKALYAELADPVFVNSSAELLGASVRIETETYDDLGVVGEDERWDKFGRLHEWLEVAFPGVHATFKKETVNSWGLVYTWNGSDDGIKPLLLMAHQDVVPVEPQTFDQWVYPPFSGSFDGQWIWGRGSVDDKGGLVAIMIAMESLIQNGFRPTRSIVLAFGFDEESSSLQGAGHIAPFLLDRYGKDSMAMIVDEGGLYDELMGAVYANPGVGEKGYIDVQITVNTKGGHSSVPPKHTGIGILSSLITKIEASPITPKLTRTNPFYENLQCLAEYSPELSGQARDLIQLSQKSDTAMKDLEAWLLNDHGSDDPIWTIAQSLITTTQAVDLIQGGVKVNALPEQAWTVINQRVSVDDSPDIVKAHLTKLLAPEAAKWNLSLEAFGTAVNTAAAAGSIVLEVAFGGRELEVAPRTPTHGPVWDLLGGTIKTVYAHNDGRPASRRTKGTTSAAEINITPSMEGGNTDTHHYWDLTRHIFRYSHVTSAGIYGGLHTINEAMAIESFTAAIEFFETLVMNVDEAQL